MQTGMHVPSFTIRIRLANVPLRLGAQMFHPHGKRLVNTTGGTPLMTSGIGNLLPMFGFLFAISRGALPARLWTRLQVRPQRTDYLCSNISRFRFPIRLNAFEY